MGYVYSFIGGLVVGGGVVYYFYAKLKSSIGAVTTTAEAIRKAV